MTKVKTKSIAKHVFRTAYQDNPRVQVHTMDARTQQDQAAACDINNILSTYMKTGVLPHQRDEHSLQYGDLSGYDFEEAQNIVAKAKTLFEELPANVRSRFNHSPAEFLDFTADENNEDEMYELGLMNKPKPEVIPEPVEASAETLAPVKGADKELST